MVEMAKAKKGVAILLAWIGITLSVLVTPSLFLMENPFCLVSSPLAIILGVIALTQASEEERAICHVAIGLGTITLIMLLLVIWILVSILST